MIRILLILLFTSSLCGQSAMDQVLAERSSTGSTTAAGFQPFDIRDKGIKGSRYLFSDWTKGILYFENGDVYDQYLINLDAYSQSIVVVDGDRLVDLPTHFVKYFSLSPEGSVSEKIFNKVKLEDQQVFAELLLDGDYQLLKIGSTKIRKANFNPALNAGEINDRFISTYKYYLSYNDQVRLIQQKKKKCLKDFNDLLEFQSLVKKFGVKNELDLIAIFQELNNN